jgi:hypothetical protein
MKYHIEMYLKGYGWVFQCNVLESDYFSAVRVLRSLHGEDTAYRLVCTRTIKAVSVVTSDYHDKD